VAIFYESSIGGAGNFFNQKSFTPDWPQGETVGYDPPGKKVPPGTNLFHGDISGPPNSRMVRRYTLGGGTPPSGL